MIKYMGYVLKYIRKQTLGICASFILKNPYLLKHVFCQTKDLCDIATEIDPFSVIYVKEQFRTKELFDRLFMKNCKIIATTPRKFITQDMCNK